MEGHRLDIRTRIGYIQDVPIDAPLFGVPRTMPRPDLYPEYAPQRYWEPETWTARHEMICDLHLAGNSNASIAELLSLSESRVSIILSDQRAESYIRVQRDRIAESLPDLLDQLKTLGPEAVAVVREDLRLADEGAKRIDSKDRAIRSKSAFGVLAALGYGPVQRSVVATVSLPADLLARQEETLAEMREIRSAVRFVAPPPDEFEDAEAA